MSYECSAWRTRCAGAEGESEEEAFWNTVDWVLPEAAYIKVAEGQAAVASPDGSLPPSCAQLRFVAGTFTHLSSAISPQAVHLYWRTTTPSLVVRSSVFQSARVVSL